MISGGSSVVDLEMKALLTEYLEPPSIGDQLIFFNVSSTDVIVLRCDLLIEICNLPCNPLNDLLGKPLGEVRIMGSKFTDHARLTVSIIIF